MKYLRKIIIVNHHLCPGLSLLIVAVISILISTMFQIYCSYMSYKRMSFLHLLQALFLGSCKTL